MKLKDKKLHPALLLFILTIIIMVVSSVGSILNLETTYYNVNAVTGELETQVVTASNGAYVEYKDVKGNTVYMIIGVEISDVVRVTETTKTKLKAKIEQ